MKTIFYLRIIAAASLSAASLLPAAAQKAPEIKLPGKEQLTAAAASYQTISEKKFYLKAYGSYALLALGGFRGQGAPPTTETKKIEDSDWTSIDQYVSSDYNLKNTFGYGLRVGGGIGSVVNDFINIGIDGEYLLGTQSTEEYTITHKEIFEDYDGDYEPDYTEVVYNTVDHKITYNHRIFNIIPNITFKAVSKPEYYIYNRLGLVIGIPSQLSYTTLTVDFPNPDTGILHVETKKLTYELDKGLGLGYQAALGIQFRISESLRGFTELVASNQLLKSNKATLSDAQSKKTYPDNYPENYPDNDKFQPIPDNKIADSDREKTGLDLNMPVNSVGVSLGLVLRF